MKATKIAIASALAILAAGCASHQSTSGTSGYGYNEGGYGTPDYTPPIGATAYGTTPSARTTQENPPATQSYFSQATNALGNAITSALGNAGQGSNVSSNEVSSAFQKLSQDAKLVGVLPNIRVGTTNGAVELKGTVNTEQQKQQIAQVFQQTTGSTNVVNDIQVSGQPEAGVAGNNSTNGVQGPQSGQMMPTSRPNEGTQVYQQGAAPNQNTPPSANPNDVNATSNGGSIQMNVPGSNPADQSLASHISQALHTNAAIQGLSSPIRVTVSNGTVTLQGSVPSRQQGQQIATAVERVPGVVNINNKLEITPGGNNNQ